MTLKIKHRANGEQMEGMIKCVDVIRVEVDSGYVSLFGVLKEALEQAQAGKGKERHAKDGEPFEQQKICEITRRVGLGGPLFQVCKKTIEAQKLGGERGVQELLGAINYLAAAIIVMREDVREPAK